MIRNRDGLQRHAADPEYRPRDTALPRLTGPTPSQHSSSAYPRYLAAVDRRLRMTSLCGCVGCGDGSAVGVTIRGVSAPFTYRGTAYHSLGAWGHLYQRTTDGLHLGKRARDPPRQSLRKSSERPRGTSPLNDCGSGGGGGAGSTGARIGGAGSTGARIGGAGTGAAGALPP